MSGECRRGEPLEEIWGHALPPEKFEILFLWNAISSVLRGRWIFDLSFLCLFLFAWLREQVLDFIFCFVQFLEFSAYQFQLGILCYVFLFTYHNNSFGKIKTDVKIEIFLIPIAYWSGFGFFKQNRKNPDEIGMVWLSALLTVAVHIL